MNSLLRTRTAASLLLALSLTACSTGFSSRTAPLSVVGVTLPGTVSPGAGLRVDVRYSVGCQETAPRLTLVSRTPQTLTLRAEAEQPTRPGPCPAVYLEGTLSYTDLGTPSRTDPFEVVVNGKSWGKVSVK